LTLEDAESGEMIWVDSSDPEWRGRFLRRQQQLAEAKKRMFSRCSVDRISITTADEYVGALTRFFRKRARRLAR
jgi:hypothetical protein